MRMKQFLSSLIFLCLSLLPVQGQSAEKSFNQYQSPFEARNVKAEMGNQIAVVELFTSETCAFCPNADRFFNDLVSQTNVIGLSCHVNYFSKKPVGLSRPICSTRQKAYAANISSGMKFTPQIIINGAVSQVGYYYDAVLNDIVTLTKKSPIRSLLISKSASPNTYQFTLTQNNAVKSADIWLALYAPTITKDITSGPNAGKTLTYARPVIALEKIQTWMGDNRTIRFRPSLRQNPAGAVILIQTDKSIIAAGEIKF